MNGAGAGDKVPPAWPGRAVVPEKTDNVLPKKFSLLGSTGSIGT